MNPQFPRKSLSGLIQKETLSKCCHETIWIVWVTARQPRASLYTKSKNQKPLHINIHKKSILWLVYHAIFALIGVSTRMEIACLVSFYNIISVCSSTILKPIGRVVFCGCEKSQPGSQTARFRAYISRSPHFVSLDGCVRSRWMGHKKCKKS